MEALATHRHATDFQPQDDMPANVFDTSSPPWTPFTGFNLNLAAADGFHASRFLQDLQDLVDAAPDWLV